MISVIIPIYNAEKELDRMLKSVQNQVFSDFEVLMIDDGSKDKSSLVCQSYVEKDQRFFYYYQENQGVSMARNYGLKRAQGEYIAFLDADDEIDENYFDELIRACIDADIAVCDVVVECEGIEKKRFTGCDSKLNKLEALNLLLMRKIINSGPCAKLYKREVISMIEFPAMKTYEDIIFNLRVFSNSSSVVYTSKTQYHYIENSYGAMNSMRKAPSTDIVMASEIIMEYIKNHKEGIAPECIYVTISHLFQYVVAMVRNECRQDKIFLNNVKKFYTKYALEIWKCKAVPIKEKIVFICIILGWIYVDKHWSNINNMR